MRQYTCVGHIMALNEVTDVQTCHVIALNRHILQRRKAVCSLPPECTIDTAVGHATRTAQLSQRPVDYDKVRIPRTHKMRHSAEDKLTGTSSFFAPSCTTAGSTRNAPNRWHVETKLRSNILRIASRVSPSLLQGRIVPHTVVVASSPWHGGACASRRGSKWHYTPWVTWIHFVRYYPRGGQIFFTGRCP